MATKSSSKPRLRVQSQATPGKPRVRIAAGGTRSEFVNSKRSAYESNGSGRRSPQYGAYGPNAALLSGLDKLRRDARALARINGYAQSGIDNIVSSVVGSGIRPITPYDDLLRLWNEWVEESDAMAQNDFYGQQALACRSMVEGGDCFGRFRPRKEGDMDARVPFQIQLLEAEHVPSSKSEKAANGNTIVGGVEVDLIDRPVAYHMYRRHPLDRIGLADAGLSTVRVPAADVMHIMRTRRPGDRRGEPWLARAIMKLHDLDEYDDAELVRKKTTALYGGFIRKPLDDDGGAVPGAEPTGDEDVVIQPLEPGTFPELPPGYEVQFSKPEDVGANFEVFRRANVSYVAASLNQTVEMLTCDWAKLGSDRVHKVAIMEYYKHVEAWQGLMIRQFCKPTWKRFVTTAIASGAWTPPAGADPRDYYVCEWARPPRRHVHPVQEVDAWEKALRLGITTRKQVVSELGGDISQVDIENAKQKAAAEALGLRYTAYQYEGELPPASAAAQALKAMVEEAVAAAVERLEVAKEDELGKAA
jgi:lambda family phage portal protein